MLSLHSVALLPAEAAEDKGKKKEIDAAIEKGLEYPKKQQANDGHFAAAGRAVPYHDDRGVAGMCFLMEGSTLKEGKYSEQITKAVNWFLAPEAPHQRRQNRRPRVTPPNRPATCTARASARCSSPAFTARKRTRSNARSSKNS